MCRAHLGEPHEVAAAAEVERGQLGQLRERHILYIRRSLCGPWYLSSSQSVILTPAAHMLARQPLLGPLVPLGLNRVQRASVAEWLEPARG